MTREAAVTKKTPSTIELLGSGSHYASGKEMKRLLDEMRAEED